MFHLTLVCIQGGYSVLDRLTESLVPVLLLKVAGVTTEDKQRFCRLLIGLCTSYLEDEPNKFRAILASTTFSEDWQTAMVKALWPDDQRILRRENPGKR